jgi:hypothetical protein
MHNQLVPRKGPYYFFKNLMGLSWYTFKLLGMAGLAHQAHQSQPIQCTISLYQERMYYFFKKLMGIFWYILRGMVGLAAHQAHNQPIPRKGVLSLMNFKGPFPVHLQIAGYGQARPSSAASAHRVHNQLVPRKGVSLL